MNSYYLAILQASNNNQFPELGDVWRNYHADSVLSDSDYQLLTDIQDVFFSSSFLNDEPPIERAGRC